MTQLSTSRSIANTPTDHINDHNEIHRLHDILDGSAGPSTPLAVAATVTAAGPLVVNKHNPVDATAAPLTMTLPTGQAQGSIIIAEKTDGSANAVTISGSIRGVGASTDVLVMQHQTTMFEADAAGSWWPVASHKALATLDGRYGFAPAPTGVAAIDTANVQALLNAGGKVFLHAATYALPYNFGTVGVVVPPYAQLWGDGNRSSCITYSGSGYAITIGNTVLGTVLAYGCAVHDLRIMLGTNTAKAITLCETGMAMVSDIYIEGLPTSNASTGIFVDGGNTSNLFTNLTNIQVNHVKFPYRWGTSGTTPSTSITAVNCTGFADSQAGSIGLAVDVSCGQGSRWFGGNLESLVTGVSISGVGVALCGLRTESNTTDVLLNAGARGNVTMGCIDLNTYTDNSGNQANVALANIKSSGSTPATLQDSVIPSNVYVGGGVATPTLITSRTLCLLDPSNCDIALVTPTRTWHMYTVGTGILGFRDSTSTFDVLALVPGVGPSITHAGYGWCTKEGTNAKQGTAVLIAGSLVVANTSVTAVSRIFLTSQVDGGTPGWLRVSARTVGTSFTITSSSATDTSTVAFEIFEPA